ncbi:MAG: hypothetical protein WBA74_03665 [Cyclobacteriaceae bacterium]
MQSKSYIKPSKIDYIVFSSPSKVREIIDNYGYTAPQDPQHLALATRQLIRRKGQRAIKDLLTIHPDRQALKHIEKQKEDSFCGACANHSFNAAENSCGICGHSEYSGMADRHKFLVQLTDKSEKELQNLYENAVKKSNKDPENQQLAEQVRLIWNELRQKKGNSGEIEKQEEVQPGFYITAVQAAILGSMALLVGGFIGHLYIKAIS